VLNALKDLDSRILE